MNLLRTLQLFHKTLSRWGFHGFFWWWLWLARQQLATHSYCLYLCIHATTVQRKASCHLPYCENTLHSFLSFSYIKKSLSLCSPYSSRSTTPLYQHPPPYEDTCSVRIFITSTYDVTYDGLSANLGPSTQNDTCAQGATEPIQQWGSKALAASNLGSVPCDETLWLCYLQYQPSQTL